MVRYNFFTLFKNHSPRTGRDNFYSPIILSDYEVIVSKGWNYVALFSLLLFTVVGSSLAAKTICIRPKPKCYIDQVTPIVNSEFDTIISELSLFEEIICSKIESLTALDVPCQTTPVTNANTTISQSGSYCVAEPITNQIDITASNVDLDLNGYLISPNGINVFGNDVRIHNGSMQVSGDALTIFDTNRIILESIVIKDADQAINANNAHDCRVSNCTFTNCLTGILLTDCTNWIIQNSIAQECEQVGFDLQSSSTCCFRECKAISTGFENATAMDAEIFGFVSNNGYGNIFERCIANATQALSTTDQNSLVAGFALRGTEKCTKIVDSESANTITSSSGVTVPYGIVLEGTLNETQSVAGALGTAGEVNSVSWSPDGQYVAIGGDSSVSGGVFQIFQFDRVNQSLSLVTSQLGTTGEVFSVSWSPDGQYIAIGGNSSVSGGVFQVFQFDRINQSLEFVANALGTTGEVNSVSWSADGQYIAIGGNSSVSGGVFQVFQFDRINQSLQFIVGALGTTGEVNAVSWSPDGQYIAVGGSVISGDEFQIFEFDRGNQTVQSVDGALAGDIINSVSWSPDGQYIATGGFGLVGSNQEFQIWQFNRDTQMLQFVTGIPSGGGGTTGFSVFWSPDGEYIAVGGSGLSGDEFQIWQFNRMSQSLQFVDGALTASIMFSVFWSPDGEYIAVGGSVLSGSNEFQILSGIQFPMKNVITNNLVYCNGHEVNAIYVGAAGVGISGSSIANMIIANTAYNNPPASENLIVGSNYYFVTNVFNPLFQNIPSAVQNISLDGCDPIAMPQDQVLIAKQIQHKLSAIVALTTLENIESVLEQLTSCNATPITNANPTISQSGSYCVAEPITNQIDITASNVDLDLNGYLISEVMNIISVSHVRVHNGTIDQAADAITTIDTSDLIFESLTIKNANRGISASQVHNSAIKNCQFINCVEGVLLTDCTNWIIQHSIAQECEQVGFDLQSSSTCCLRECKALATGFENTTAMDAEIFGFVSNNGYGNIFERCIANATQALSATDQNSLVAGFALRGTEKCTKIVDSESANTITSSSGVTVPYGIVLEGTLNETQSVAGALGTAGEVNSVSWSPDGQYIAIGGDSSVSGGVFQIFQFDRVNQSLSLITSQLGTTGEVFSVSWSPDGQYIAVGGNSSISGGVFQVFQFDRINQSLEFVASALGTAGEVNSVSWSPDGQYIAVGGNSSVSGGVFQVFQFDRINQSLEFIASALGTTGEVNAVSWSPDGLYIAVGGTGITGDDFQIFEFDRVNQTLQSVDGDLAGDGIFSISWSPDGQYIATGGFGSTGSGEEFRIWQFNRDTQMLQFVTGIPSGGGGTTGFSVFWSPDGEYIAVGGSGLSGDEFQIWQFNRMSQSLQFVDGAITAAPINSVFWSPDGEYIAVGGATLSGGNEFQILSGIQFPMKNVITNNLVYCNGHEVNAIYVGAAGVGISGSSIANMIIANTAYNNPPASENLIVGSNYYFVTNVFNPLFQNTPSAVQNISLDGCDPIAMPLDQVLIAKQIRNKLCNVESSLEELVAFSNAVSNIASCSPTNISSAQTISSSGTYRCCQNIIGDITIAASDVVLDLNKYKITGGIIVNSDLDQITIRNGVVEDGSSGDGILVNSGATNITIENVTVKNTTRGIHFDAVANGLIDQVTLVENTTGLQLENSYNIAVFDSTAKSNLQAGYELLNSTTCCLLDSKALSTGLNNTNLFGDESNVYGFVLNDSYGNIIERCIANATQNLSATAYDTIVAGFALLGTDTQCNKIIGCEAANATANSTGFTVPYGILLQPQLDSLASLTGALGVVGQANSVAWSPDGQYVAVGGDTLAGDELQLFSFDRASNSLTLLDSALTGTINAISWSPDEQYLAIVGDNLTGDEFQIFSFSRINNSLTFVVSSDFAMAQPINAVAWSPDGQFIAVGGDNLPGDEFQIFSFDRVNHTLTHVANSGLGGATINAVPWRPDGRYIAAGGNIPSGSGDNLQIFSFNGITLTLVDGVLGLTGTVNSLSWSPDGRFIAVGGDGLTNGELQIFAFDGNNLTFAAGIDDAAGSANAVSWSPDGRFVAVGGNGLSIGTGDQFQIFYFDRSSNTLNAVVGDLTGTILSINWAPDGQYIALGGAGLSGENELQIFSGLEFPIGNIIINNTVYCNSNGIYGVGISGSSIANCIIQNNVFNNPLSYTMVTNEFNQLFGVGPTLVQNIGIDSCQVITTPPSISQGIKRLELLLESLVENLL